MGGFFSLPQGQHGSMQIFRCIGVPYTYQTWVKPKGAAWCGFILIGSGGGGGNGHTRAKDGDGGGGGGGAGASVASFIMPAFALPGLLYVSVAQGASATAGDVSFLSFDRSLTTFQTLAASGGGGAAAGANGSSSGGGGGASAPAAAGARPFGQLGLFTAYAGDAGKSGGGQTGQNGTSITNVWSVSMVSGGAGGGGSTGTDFNGGNISGGAFDLTFFKLGTIPDVIVNGGIGGAVQSNGAAGLQLWEPFIVTGGAGGGTNNAGTAGDGGIGGIGCGGGGGGAGVAGGKGGAGGNGLVIAYSW